MLKLPNYINVPSDTVFNLTIKLLSTAITLDYLVFVYLFI